MSLKAIELQIAISKTFDAGKVVDQLQQQSSVNQSNAQAASARQLEKNRETVTEINHATETDLNDKKQNGSEEERKKQKIKELEQKQIKHPFKGKFVDYSG